MEKRKGVSGNARVFQTSSVGWVLPDTNFATTFASTKEPQKASASHTPPLTPTLVSVASPAAPNFINFNPSAHASLRMSHSYVPCSQVVVIRG